jgi:hypothetical protein
MRSQRMVRIVRRPPGEVRPDCLAEMLMDFLALDHAALSKEELQDWLTTVAVCLGIFLKNDSRNGPQSSSAVHWLQAITNRLARALPDYPGGRRMIRRTIEGMVLQHWLL